VGVQFIFCVRGSDDRHVGFDDVIGVIPNGFEDRVEGRGLVIKGRAPTSGYTEAPSCGCVLDSLWVELDVGRDHYWGGDVDVANGCGVVRKCKTTG